MRRYVAEWHAKSLFCAGGAEAPTSEVAPEAKLKRGPSCCLQRVNSFGNMDFQFATSSSRYPRCSSRWQTSWVSSRFYLPWTHTTLKTRAFLEAPSLDVNIIVDCEVEGPRVLVRSKHTRRSGCRHWVTTLIRRSLPFSRVQHLRLYDQHDRQKWICMRLSGHN